MKNKTLLIAALSVLNVYASHAQSFVPDNNFGVGGKFSKAATGDNIAIYGSRDQPDGKVIACGCWMGNSGCDSAVAFRLKANGTLDSTFGVNGYVSKWFGGTDPMFNDIAVLSTGKIAILGYDVVNNFEQSKLLMYSSTGVIDNSFGTQGVVTYNPPAKNLEFYYIKKQSNDKLIVGGTVFGATYQDLYAELRRYNTNGTLDNTFATNGSFSVTANGKTGSNDDVIVDAQDNIYFPLVDVTSMPSFSILSEAKLTANGTLTASWGNAGVSDTVHDTYYSSHPVLMSNGKLMFGTINGPTIPTLNVNTFRFTTNGHKDATYGVNGRKSFSFSGFDQGSNWYTVENNNKIIFAFDQASATSSGNRDAVMIQADSNGNQDMSFGTNGVIRTGIGQGVLFGWAFKQADGKLVLCANDNNYTGVVLRFKPGTTGIQPEVANELAVLAYPNPVTNVLALEAPEGTQYTVYNAMGKLAMRGKTELPKELVNTSNLQPGIYYIDCRNGNERAGFKIEKQ